MNKPNRERKGEIKEISAIQLNEEQKEATRLIIENQIVVITGPAGSGKSLVGAKIGLHFLHTKQAEKVFVTRAAIEVGKSLGYLPGGLDEKFNPYLEAFIDNLNSCTTNKSTVTDLLAANKIVAAPIQFIRGKTINDVLIIEEAQNTTKGEMLAMLTRLGKTGKIIINGDNAQMDTKEDFTGLSYVIHLSKHIPEIKWIKLKENHRSDLVGKILDFEYGK